MIFTKRFDVPFSVSKNSNLNVVLRVLGLFILTSVGVLAATNKVERTFKTIPGAKLLLVTDIGSIKVTTWNKHEVSMSVTIDGSEENVRAFRLSHTHKGGVIKIRGVRSSRNPVGWGPETTAKFVLRVPTSFNVDLNSTAGPIDIVGLSGVIRLRSELGNVHIKKSFGNIDVASKSGEVQVYSCQGTVRAENISGTILAKSINGVVNSRTMEGEITVDNIRGGLHLYSVQGDITISLSRQTTTVIAETAQGDIILKMPKGFACSIEASSQKGDVDTDWNVRFRGTSDPRYLHGMVNGGGPLLRLATHSGDIEISD